MVEGIFTSRLRIENKYLDMNKIKQKQNKKRTKKHNVKM